MKNESAVEFSGKSRIHVAIEVANLARSLEFYRILFGVEPTKQRPGYVKFEPAEPSVNFTLNERAGSRQGEHSESRSPMAHYGVQVKSVEAVKAVDERFRAAGYSTRIEEQTTCCYAVQDKVWVIDPDGNSWEAFVVLEAEAPERQDPEAVCCPEQGAGDHGASSSRCC